MRLGRFIKSVVITGLSTRRKNSNEALDLFEELPHRSNQNQEINNCNCIDEYTHKKKNKKIVRFLRRSLNRHTTRDKTDNILV
jgi:hypothetical protein